MTTTKQVEPKFVFDPDLSDDALASLLLEHYRIEADLTGNPLEKPLLYSGDSAGPERYMRVFTKAEIRADSAGNAERQISFMLEALNGARRRPGKWPVGKVEHLLDYIPRILPAVSPADRKARLTELYWYHTGLVFHLLGKFDRAAEAQHKAADFARARGNEQSAIICDAQGAYESACGAIARNNTDEIATALNVLRLQSSRLDELDDSTETNSRWKYGNGPVHRMVMHFLGGVEYEALDEDYWSVKDMQTDLRGVFAGWIEVVEQIRNLMHLSKGQGVRIRRGVKIDDTTFTHCVDVEERAAALIFMATAVARGMPVACPPGCCGRGEVANTQRREYAGRIYQQVVDFPEHGAEVFRAVARREIGRK